MNAQPIPPADAARALTEIHTRQEQVVLGTLVPDWFWLAISLLMVGFVAAMETHRPLWIIIGSVVYALGLAASIGPLLLLRYLRRLMSGRPIGDGPTDHGPANDGSIGDRR